MAAMEPAAARRRVRIEAAIGEDVVVEGDSFLLMQATINLLANAIDFSPPDATVELAVTTSDRNVEISVRDHGPGVPDYALDRIFEKFYSLHRPDTGKKGTGLGLAFVREIAHLHGGEARLGNHVEGGAVASMILPLPASRR
jgi:two-component system sensor histidine kinase CreC